MKKRILALAFAGAMIGSLCACNSEAVDSSEVSSTVSVVATATPTTKPTATPTAKPTATPTAKPTATPTPTPTPSPTATPTPTPIPTPVPTPTPEPYIPEVDINDTIGDVDPNPWQDDYNYDDSNNGSNDDDDDWWNDPHPGMTDEEYKEWLDAANNPLDRWN